jgi:hypothetical protein
MIFLVHKHHRYTIEGYLESRWCQELAGRIRILSYHDLLRMSELPEDTYIFCDHERLTKEHTDLAISIWRQLENSGKPIQLLNNPAKVLRRYHLLQTLFVTGRNFFNVMRATDAWQHLRYPVFVRKADDHAGSLTPLLHSQPEVEQALEDLTPRFRSGRTNLLVIEFCDTSSGSGRHRKFSAFGVRDQILPRYLSSSTDWQVKSTGPPTETAAILEERQFFNDNPHEAWLRDVFKIAHIDYGRIDYGVLDGKPQIWEINTNPMMTALPEALRGPRPELPKDIEAEREQNRAHFHTRFRAALQEIDGDRTTTSTIPITIDPALWQGESQWVSWFLR